MKKRLGKLTKLENLRDYWPHEALDFTPWLAEESNIAMLGDAIGMEIVVEETESPVGNFNADILARERDTDRIIIIENQLGETDHDHLGKIITYASGKDASYIIWVVRKSREEHRCAIEWLNNRTDDNTGFFLVETELWSIDDSDAAVQFKVVEQPNGWVKEIKRSNLVMSEVEKLRLQFWSEYAEMVRADNPYSCIFRCRRPSGKYYFDLIPVRAQSFHLVFFIDGRLNRIGTEIYIPDNKELYFFFYNNKVAIEQDLGYPLDWRESSGKKSCRIVVRRDADITQLDEWTSYFNWMKMTSIQLHDAFAKATQNMRYQHGSDRSSI